MRHTLVCLFLSLGLVLPLKAVTQCALTAEPTLVRKGGLADPLGSIIISCTGAPLLEPLRGSIQVSTSTFIANRLVDGFLPDIKIAIDVSGTWTDLPGVTARPVAVNSVAIENINTSFDPQGRVALRISGLRAESADSVMATLNYSGTPELPVRFSLVTIGYSSPGLYSSGTTTIQSASPALPPDFNFTALLSLPIPKMSTRVTEASANTFLPATAGASNGLRVLVRFSGIVEQATVLIPDAIAGSSARTPTSGGDMGLPVSPGEYETGAGRTLLLSRVHGADSLGAGGELVFTPAAGVNLLNGLGPTQISQGVHYAVYEVIDANPAALETFQFPAFVVLPPDYRAGGPLPRQTAFMGPISSARGASATAPIPRFVSEAAPNDCPLINDCGAGHFPQLNATPTSPLFFAAPAGAPHQIGYILIHNIGGGILEWHATVRYRVGSATNWIRVMPEAGAGQATLRFDVIPTNLLPGLYEADLVITGLANAGLRSFPITLQVLNQLPPAEPPPAVRDVVNAANRLPGHVAPASLALVLGSNFGPTPRVTVGNIPARVLAAQPEEILIEIPPALPLDPRAPVVVERDGLLSIPWGVEIAPVTPAVASIHDSSGAPISPTNPAVAGSPIQLRVTGIRFAAQPVYVKIHDQEIAQLLPAPPGEVPPDGIDILRFTVPEFFPTMSTAILVCGQPPSQPELRRCAQPIDLNIQQRP